MSTWLETVRFHREMHCEECGALLARRAGNSPVYSFIGERIESADDYDVRGDYVMRCDCGAWLEFRTPEDAQQYKEAEEGIATGRAVVRLRDWEPSPATLRALERAKQSIDRHANEQNVPTEDADAIKSFAENLVTGTASDEQEAGAREALKKFGPKVALALYEELKDFAARTTAYILKPY